MVSYEAASESAERRYELSGVLSLSIRSRVYWLFALPAFISAFLFIFLPLLYAGYLSLHDFSLLRLTNRFIGFGNYARILADPGFLNAFVHTVVYVVVVVSVDFLLGFTQALVLFHLRPLWSKTLRGVFLLPMLLIPSAAAMLWRSAMYSPPFQEFNRILGIPSSFTMLGQPQTSLAGVILTVIWAWSPWVFLLLLGGLEGLDTAPLEAAQLDGANFWQSLRYIILPMMRPIIFVALSFKAVDSYLSFTFPWVMTQGGPADSSALLNTYIYHTAFSALDYGYGSSMAIVMMLLGVILSTGVIIYAWRLDYV